MIPKAHSLFWVACLLFLAHCKETPSIREPINPIPAMTARQLQQSYLNGKTDRPFSYQDPFFSNKIGPFTILQRPNWANFSPLTGLLEGIPTQLGNVNGVVFQSGSGANLVSSSPLGFPVLGDPLKPVGLDMGIRQVLNLDITGDGVRIAISDTGLEIKHEDLRDNVIPNASKNYLSGSEDPTLLDQSQGFCHGTAVAGVIAMTGWNGVGGRGIAPYAGIAGLNFLEGFNKNPASANLFLLDQAQGNFDIFNQSWGAEQNTWVPTPPGSSIDLYFQKLQAGANNLRGGKGALYVKAAGNVPEINAAVDPYQRSPFLIVVGALDSVDRKAAYSSSGANLWLSAFGGEPVTPGSSPKLITTDSSGCQKGLSRSGNCNYSSNYQGTSFAAPAISGTIALMLEQQPQLNWREVKHVLASTALKVEPGNLGWITNKAGFHFHNAFGFGKVQAEQAVLMAKSFQVGSLGALETVQGSVNSSFPLSISSEASASLAMEVSQDLVIETVAVELNLEHEDLQNLQIELMSPTDSTGASGTKSILLARASSPDSSNIPGVKFISNAFYGEPAAGTWTLSIANSSSTRSGNLRSVTFSLLGHRP
ncbi:hypothetical protein EBT16_08870 [bacterium]|nr:hypothetical protein [bacterium]